MPCALQDTWLECKKEAISKSLNDDFRIAKTLPYICNF